jgi:hypothetical protein
MTQTFFTTLRSVTLVLPIALLVGCASFAGHRVPDLPYGQLKPSADKPAIDYDITTQFRGEPHAGFRNKIQERVNAVFSRSEMFSSMQAGIGSAPYHLSIVYNNEGDLWLAAITGFFSGLTFTVLPGYSKDTLLFTIDVKRGDQVLKQYRYQDSMTTWIQLFMVFVMANHWPMTVAEETVDNILRNFLHDLDRDGILQGTPLPAPAKSEVAGVGAQHAAPLVYPRYARAVVLPAN